MCNAFLKVPFLLLLYWQTGSFHRSFQLLNVLTASFLTSFIPFFNLSPKSFLTSPFNSYFSLPLCSPFFFLLLFHSLLDSIHLFFLVLHFIFPFLSPSPFLVCKYISLFSTLLSFTPLSLIFFLPPLISLPLLFQSLIPRLISFPPASIASFTLIPPIPQSSLLSPLHTRGIHIYRDTMGAIITTCQTQRERSKGKKRWEKI